MSFSKNTSQYGPMTRSRSGSSHIDPALPMGPLGNIPPRERRRSRNFQTPAFSSPAERHLPEPVYHPLHDKTSIIRHATHQELLAYNNEIYSGLYDAYLKQKARYDELCIAHSSLLRTIGSSLESKEATLSPPIADVPVPLPRRDSLDPDNAPYDIPIPKQEDHLHLKFWTQRKYNEFIAEKKKTDTVVDPTRLPARRGGTRLALTNENVACDYIEREDGTIVDGDTAASIRKYVRGAFRKIEDNANMTLPSSWTYVGLTESQFIITKVYKKYPYMALCDDDWKVKFLASRVLTSIHQAKKRAAENAAKQKRIKTEKEETPEDHPSLSDPTTTTTATADVATSSPKRKTPPLDNDSLSKRPRVDSLAIDTSPHSSPLPPPSDISIEQTQASAASVHASPTHVAASPGLPKPARTPGAGTTTEPVEDSTMRHPPSEPLMVINPLEAIFGPAAGPSTRLESLRTQRATASAAPQKTQVKENGRKKNETIQEQSKVAMAGMKRVTRSSSPKNLCYIDYLTRNMPITTAAFDTYWKQLGKDEIKKWNVLSKSKKESTRQEDEDDQED